MNIGTLMAMAGEWKNTRGGLLPPSYMRVLISYDGSMVEDFLAYHVHGHWYKVLDPIKLGVSQGEEINVPKYWMHLPVGPKYDV